MVRTRAGLSLILLVIALGLGCTSEISLHRERADPRPMITEFMAYNKSSLADCDGDYADWIEIYNAGPVEIDLGGWYLSDNHDDLAKWQFPDVSVTAGGFLVLFASGKGDRGAGPELHTNFSLDREGEYIALIEPNGKTIASEYVITGLPQYADVSYGLAGASNERYLSAPTPGRPNDSSEANRGPILSEVNHTPSVANSGESITVTAQVKQSLAPVDAVTLHYRVMYEEIVPVPMFDDGAHGDRATGDGVYGAIIPDQAFMPGEMVRYYVTATDRAGQASRWPLFVDPLHSPEYLGTVVVDPDVNSLLPTLYWFTQDPAAAETTAGVRSSVFYVGSPTDEGTYYDNLFTRQRGHASKSWPKKSLKFDFNPGYHFRFAPDQEPVEEFNLNTTSSDQAYIRQVLAWETYRDVGAPYSISFPMRVQQNGAFHSIGIFVEQPSERYLNRLGLDPNGSLYKLKFNPLTTTTEGLTKLTRLHEDYDDLQSLVDGLNLSGRDLGDYLFDHVNVPAVINSQAAATIIHDRDWGHNNYYMYRDTEGTGEWMILPWDKDLTFGLNYDEGLDLEIKADDDPQSHPLSCYTQNQLVEVLLNTPITREMYLRRLRTLMDERLQPPDTPPGERYYERRIDELFTQMQLDVALDAARWVPLAGPKPFAQALDDLRTDYLDVRRVHLYKTHGPENRGMIPAVQPITTTIRFGDVGFAAAGAGPETEHLTLVNDNEYAVDISGWRVSGAITYRFQPGVVIPAGRTLYVSPDVVAFRTLAAGERTGHFVQGNYEGRMSGGGGILRLYGSDGALVASKPFLDRNLVFQWPMVGAVSLLALSVLLYRRIKMPASDRAKDPKENCLRV